MSARSKRTRVFHRANNRAGSTLFVALIVLAALSFFAAYTFQRISPGLRVAYQNAAWQEARVAAESGIDAAIGDLVRYEAGSAANPWEGWRQQTATGTGDVPPSLLKQVLSTTGTLLGSVTSLLGLGGTSSGSGSTGSGSTTDPIYLDNVKISAANGVPTEVNVQLWALRPTDVRSKAVIRIRSMATCALPPAAYQSPFSLDVPLRRFNLRTRRERIQQDDVGEPSRIPLPNVTRTVEVLVEPITPFELGIWAKEGVSLPQTGRWTVDSYDSRDPAHSNANGTYPGIGSPKVLSEGHVASNRTRPAEEPYGPLIEVNGAAVEGWIATNGGDDPNTPEPENVSGALAFQSERFRDDFSREMRPVSAPAISSPTPAPPAGVPFSAGPANSPTYYRAAGNLGSFTVSAPFGGAVGAVVILVEGDLDVSGGPIIIPPNVVAEIYVKGNVNLQDGAINSGPWNSNRAAQLLIFGVGDGDQTRTVTARGDARIHAAFYGPGYDAHVDGSVVWSGSIGAKSFSAPWGGDGGIHYDAALATIGPPISFRVIRYIDDVRQ